MRERSGFFGALNKTPLFGTPREGNEQDRITYMFDNPITIEGLKDGKRWGAIDDFGPYALRRMRDWVPNTLLSGLVTAGNVCMLSCCCLNIPNCAIDYCCDGNSYADMCEMGGDFTRGLARSSVALACNCLTPVTLMSNGIFTAVDRCTNPVVPVLGPNQLMPNPGQNQNQLAQAYRVGQGGLVPNPNHAILPIPRSNELMPNLALNLNQSENSGDKVSYKFLQENELKVIGELLRVQKYSVGLFKQISIDKTDIENQIYIKEINQLSPIKQLDRLIKTYNNFFHLHCPLSKEDANLTNKKDFLLSLAKGWDKNISPDIYYIFSDWKSFYERDMKKRVARGECDIIGNRNVDRALHPVTLKTKTDLVTEFVEESAKKLGVEAKIELVKEKLDKEQLEELNQLEQLTQEFYPCCEPMNQLVDKIKETLVNIHQKGMQFTQSSNPNAIQI